MERTSRSGRALLALLTVIMALVWAASPIGHIVYYAQGNEMPLDAQPLWLIKLLFVVIATVTIAVWLLTPPPSAGKWRGVFGFLRIVVVAIMVVSWALVLFDNDINREPIQPDLSSVIGATIGFLVTSGMPLALNLFRWPSRPRQE